MYLITGSAGFIGFHMCNLLLKKNKKVIGIDSLNHYYSDTYKLKRLSILKKYKNFKFHKINLCNKEKIKHIFDNYKIKHVIHFAAQPGVVYSYKDPKSYLLNNILATGNLVEILKDKEIDNFIFASSSSVYGDHKKYPIKENFKLKPKNYYAKTKNVCENIIKKKLKNENFTIQIVRPFTVYGPYGRPDMLILKMLSSIRKNRKINIYNYGKHLRDFTYVSDVTNVILKLLYNKTKKIKIFNICASKPIEINKIIILFNKYLKVKLSIILKKKRKGEMNITYGSNQKLKSVIGKFEFTKIENGLKKTVDWYKLFKHKKLVDIHK